MNVYNKMQNFSGSLLHMDIMIKTLIAISARGIEINFMFTLLKTTFIAVETLIPSSGRVLKCIMARVSAFAYLICRKFSKWAKHQNRSILF